MYKEILTWLAIGTAYITSCLAPASAQEYLPPGVNTIDPPFNYVDRILDASRTEQHLVMIATSDTQICQGPGFPLCPTFHFYERQADSWVLQQTFEFSETGIARVQIADTNKFVISRSMTNEAAPDFEIVEYNFNPTTNLWERSIISTGVVAPSYLTMGKHGDAYVLIGERSVAFMENVSGTWQQTDILYLSSVRDFTGLYAGLFSVVQDGSAYIAFCESGNCESTRGIAVVDLESRTFTHYFEYQTPNLIGFAVIGDQVIISSDDPAPPFLFQAPQVYENVGGAWQYIGDALPSFEWNSKDNQVERTDSLFFETRTARLDLEDADALTYFERNISGDWEQIGSVMIPNGDRISNSMTLAQVYGNSVYFLDSPGGKGLRILEVTDYFDYLDRDKDIMPQWWEEQYGFSPDAFDDFLGDTDQDGLTDTREYGLQTSPINSDTDGDQMRDDWELRYFFDPRDPSDGDEDLDLDGVSNRNEYLNGTNPMIADGPIVTNPPQSSGGGGGSTSIIWLFLVFAACWVRFRGRRACDRLRM